jgi:hypothetical protein
MHSTSRSVLDVLPPIGGGNVPIMRTRIGRWEVLDFVFNMPRVYLLSGASLCTVGYKARSYLTMRLTIPNGGGQGDINVNINGFDVIAVSVLGRAFGK